MLRTRSPLSNDAEALITQVIGSCTAVHRAFGPGVLETIYARTVCLELTAVGIAFEREKIPVFYRDELVCTQRLDVVVEDRIALEIKSERVHPVHQAQLELFAIVETQDRPARELNVPILPQGLKRIVL